MSIPGRSTRLLNEIHSQSTKEFLDSINSFLQELEEKTDPEVQEIFIVENIHQFLEKFNMLRANLEKLDHVKKKSLPGNKLSELMNEKDLYSE